MIIFLYGSDAYRLKQAKEDLVKRYQTKYSSGMNLFTLDLAETDSIDKLKGAFKNSSFFNEHRLVVSKNVFDKKAVAVDVHEQIKEQGIAKSPEITLIIAENLTAKELAAKNKELFKFLSDTKNTVKEFEPLSGDKLSEWIKKEFVSKRASIGQTAIKELIETAGVDSWSLINEIDKLTNYKTGEVTSADIRNMVTAKADMNIFDLIDALGTKDRQRAIKLLYQELKTGRDPYYILTMIIYQFRNILMIKDLQKRGHSESEIGQKTKLHPFVIKKISRSSFDSTQAARIYAQLLALDTGFKTGEINLEDSLYNLTTQSY